MFDLSSLLKLFGIDEAEFKKVFGELKDAFSEAKKVFEQTEEMTQKLDNVINILSILEGKLDYLEGKIEDLEEQHGQVAFQLDDLETDLEKFQVRLFNPSDKDFYKIGGTD